MEPGELGLRLSGETSGPRTGRSLYDARGECVTVFIVKQTAASRYSGIAHTCSRFVRRKIPRKEKPVKNPYPRILPRISSGSSLSSLHQSALGQCILRIAKIAKKSAIAVSYLSRSCANATQKASALTQYISKLLRHSCFKAVENRRASMRLALIAYYAADGGFGSRVHMKFYPSAHAPSPRRSRAQV